MGRLRRAAARPSTPAPSTARLAGSGNSAPCAVAENDPLAMPVAWLTVNSSVPSVGAKPVSVSSASSFSDRSLPTTLGGSTWLVSDTVAVTPLLLTTNRFARLVNGEYSSGVLTTTQLTQVPSAA